MKAPAGSYLILARPRSRTAWLSALLCGPTPCFHDEVLRLPWLLLRGEPFGLIAPSLPAANPRAIEWFAECPLVVIERPAEESYPALERFVGFKIPGAAALEERYQAMLAALPRQRLLTVRFEELDDFSAVNAIHQHCLRRPLDPDRFHVFNKLRIEQHLPKVKAETEVELRRRVG